MQFLAKSAAKADGDFREASRREDAGLLRRAFPAPSNRAVARKAAPVLGACPRQIIYWLTEDCDMPSWAVKATENYIRGVLAVARKIEGA